MTRVVTEKAQGSGGTKIVWGLEGTKESNL